MPCPSTLLLLTALLWPSTKVPEPDQPWAPPAATLEQDCNDNGIEDSVDIAFGSSSDANANGVPDECERAREGAAGR